MFYAHSIKNSSSKDNWQPLDEHLINVGKLAGECENELGLKNSASIAGLLHDIGKYRYGFQKRLEGSSDKIPHADAGAILIRELFKDKPPHERLMADIIAYCIAGHHAGLHNPNNLRDFLSEDYEEIDEIWKREIGIEPNNIFPTAFNSPIGTNNKEIIKNKKFFAFAVMTRMIFSCLVDADYKDTEKFYNKVEGRETDRVWHNLINNIDALIDNLNKHLAKIAAKTQADKNLAELRQEILKTVTEGANRPQGIYTLNVPTGGGKTLTSLSFALNHAKKHNLERIIYSIPFTSIIDQNAAIFKEILSDDFVLEHHSSIDETKNEGRERRDKLKLAMEDWAAPVIITTNVQLFESLFSNRPSKCRKLKNIANSVLILDEVQSLPVNLLIPSLYMLDELARNYNVTVILCTATMPAFDIKDFEHGFELGQDKELAPKPEQLAQQLKRVKIEHGFEYDDDELLNDIKGNSQGLIIVNSRRHALELYDKAKSDGIEGLYHLTTRQCAIHRKKILEKIRIDLKNEKPCIVIATSLVEAGVDLDFPKVWREITGLDSIAQAAGRCNREGRRPLEDSIVKVFKAKEYNLAPEIQAFADAFNRMSTKHDDLLMPDAIKHYFREVYWQKGAALDAEGIINLNKTSGSELSVQFQDIAQKYKMIKSIMVPVIVDYEGLAQPILERLNNPEVSPGKAARDLQQLVIQVPQRAFDELIKNWRVSYRREDLWGTQFAVLESRELYKETVGLRWDDADKLEPANSIF